VAKKERSSKGVQQRVTPPPESSAPQALSTQPSLSNSLNKQRTSSNNQNSLQKLILILLQSKGRRKIQKKQDFLCQGLANKQEKSEKMSGMTGYDHAASYPSPQYNYVPNLTSGQGVGATVAAGGVGDLSGDLRHHIHGWGQHSQHQYHHAHHHLGHTMGQQGPAAGDQVT
jgi:hypothetical protein